MKSWPLCPIKWTSHWHWSWTSLLDELSPNLPGWFPAGEGVQTNEAALPSSDFILCRFQQTSVMSTSDWLTWLQSLRHLSTLCHCCLSRNNILCYLLYLRSLIMFNYVVIIFITTVIVLFCIFVLYSEFILFWCF